MPSSRLPILLGLAIALLLAGVAVWVGIEAHRVSNDADRLAAEASALDAKARARTDGVDIGNAALVDPARTAEVSGAIGPVLEKVLSYDYRDLASTEQAVGEHLVDKARCEYDQLFGEVKRLAPEQKLVLTSRVRELGVTRLERARATLLAFVDQTTNRADQGQQVTAGTQFVLSVESRDGRWKIAKFDFLNQPLPNGNVGLGC